MAPWVSWATATATQSIILHSLGVKTEVYTDPNREGPGDPLYTDEEATFAHDCNGKRITFPTKPGKYLMDPHSSKLATLWKDYVAGVGGDFDAVYEDSADNVVGVTNALPCHFEQADWTSATNSMDDALDSSIIYNGLGTLSDNGGEWSVSPAIGLNASSIGGTMEGCYSSAGSNPKPHEKVWAVMENTELEMVAGHKLFKCRGLNESSASQSISLRVYMDGSFLLTYDPSSSILAEKFTTPSGFLVNPESEFVPLDPLLAEPEDVSALQLPSGIYGRQYAACYLYGVSVGSCAVVVNADQSKSESFPWPGKYEHTLSLQGSDVLDGGTVSVTAGAPPHTVDPETAVIAIQ